MKKLILGLSVVCAVAYLAVPFVADAQSGARDPVYAHERVAPQFVSPDGGRVQGRASATGEQYVVARGQTADGGTAAPLLGGDRRTVVWTVRADAVRRALRHARARA